VRKRQKLQPRMRAILGAAQRSCSLKQEIRPALGFIILKTAMARSCAVTRSCPLNLDLQSSSPNRCSFCNTSDELICRFCSRLLPLVRHLTESQDAEDAEHTGTPSANASSQATRPTR
jgi:hypothetical protein